MTAGPELGVCVVDDDPAMRDSLQLLLSAAGFRTTTYASAYQFLEGFDPDGTGCVLLDVRMKGMSGLELQRELAAQHPTIPVVLISGHADVPMAVQAMRSGAVDVVEKPFDHDALLARVRECIRESKRLRERHREVEKVRKALEKLTPREREVAELLGISLEEYHRILQDATGARVFSFDDPGTMGEESEPRSLEAGNEPLDNLQHDDFQKALAEAIAGLPERERLVMALYYDEELNLREIGEVLGVSESRVCQIHGQALIRLRARMGEWTGD